MSCRRISRTARRPYARRATFGPTAGSGYRAATCLGWPHARRLALVDEAFRTLPERYLGAEPGFDATYHVRLGDIGPHLGGPLHHARRARAQGRHAAGAPDVTIGTDAETWLRLREGELSGIEAFSQRQLYARGDLDLAVGFEGLFRLPERPPAAAAHPRRARRADPRLAR